MIIKKNDDRNLLPTDVIGRSVARSKRWLVAIVRIWVDVPNALDGFGPFSPERAGTLPDRKSVV